MSHNRLTIVIPAKNEARLLPVLLASLCRQDYPQLPHTKVFVADAGSTDGTQDIARSFGDRLDIEVIPGGLPSVGRNAGARRAETKYVLFIDADMELKDPTLLRRTMELTERRNLHCVTTNIWCSNGTLRDHVLYALNDIAQYGSLMLFPFSTGMFMLFDKNTFDRLGGFHEGALYAEDYLLSKKVANWRFGVVRGRIHTTNRRFRNMGHLKIVSMFLKTMFNSWNDNYFLRDHGYWRQKV
ncbi:MAG: glycosyltransferase family 2 protein [Acidobacteriia bacterium]|nr:glycosyltransferase family 2 protein [Terriglobia bacterium]